MTGVPYTVEDHIKLRRVGTLAESPCGTWLAVSVQRLDIEGTKYVTDLWRVPLDGSAAVQLTRGDTRDVAPCFRHDGALGFLSNRQPNEKKGDAEADKRMQVWLLPAAGGEPQQLTDEPLGVDAFKFAANADRMVMFASVLNNVPHDKQRETAAEREKKGSSVRVFRSQPTRHWDSWLHHNNDRANTHLILSNADATNRIDLTPDATTQLSIEPHMDISADGTRALVEWRIAGKDRELDDFLTVFDLATHMRTTIAQGENTMSNRSHFSPDGKSIATTRATRSAKDLFKLVMTIIDEQGNARELAKEWDRWPDFAAWSPDSQRVIVTVEDNGAIGVFAIDATSGEVTRLTPDEGCSHSEVKMLSKGGFACVRSSLLDVPECYVYDGQPGEHARALHRLSNFTPASDWAQTESITTISTDGTPIQSWVTKPKNATGKMPVLFWIHGGPIGMAGDGFHWRWNSLIAAAQGYIVVQPNPRGSTGFGQKFVQGIWGNVWGDQCYKDLMAVADAIEQWPDVDAKRITAMGGSFGGYMTNWIGTQTDRFANLVTHASIVTMAAFTGTTDHPAWWYLEMGGENPYATPDEYDRYAPIRHVSKWKTRTLIIHGEQDYRCPIGEGLNLFEALQYHGVESQMMVFPDENHWILKPRNVVAWYEGVLGWAVA